MFSSCFKKLVATSFISLAMLPSSAHAGPEGGVVEAGSATITQPNTQTTQIDQSTNKAVIAFDNFNTATGEQVNIVQPGTHSILYVKDNQNSHTQINGQIDANGKLWIRNRNGILVGKTGTIDAAAILLTTSSMTSEDFMSGNYNFSDPGDPQASIIIEGALTAKDLGFIGVAAPGVRNEGVLNAQLSKVALASGNRFTLDLRGDGLFNFAPSDEVLEQVLDLRTGKPLKHLVSNAGEINAAGGIVTLSAVSTRLLLDSVIDNSGRITAPTYKKKVGKVVFSTALPSQQRAELAAAKRQKVTVSGTVDVSGRGENQTGGEILILGEVLGLTNATLDASGDAGGGLVLIGGTYFGNKLTDVEKQDLGVRTASQNVFASQETIMQNTTIIADALSFGKGGQVVVRANNRAAIHGSISVQGENGLVDTSGLNQLALDADVDVSNRFGGKAGTWGIDPGNITVADTAAAIDFTNPFTASTTTTVAASDIETTLNAGGDVHILTDGGRIDVNADIIKSSGDESTLRFDSTDGFTLATGKKIERKLTSDYETNRADLNVIIDGNTDRDGTGTTEIAGQIITLGGDVSIKGQRITLNSGAVQTLNDPDGNDGNVDIVADVTAPFPAWAVIGLGRQAITAGNGRVYVEARSLASDDTISFGGSEAIRSGNQVTVVADKIEANPSTTPHINLTSSAPTPSITGTQAQPVVVGRTYFYTPQTSPPPTVNTPPTVGAGTLLNHTIEVGSSFNYTLPNNTFADDGGVTTLELSATGLPTGLNFSDNNNGTGTVSGSPTTTGTFTVTVSAKDLSGEMITRTFRIVVESATTPPPPTNTPPTTTSQGVIFTYSAGQAFSFTTPIDMFADDGGVANLTLSAIDLQPWMSFVDNGNGTATISGTPLDTNTYRPTVIAKDAGGLTVQKAVRLEINAVTIPTPTPTSNPPTLLITGPSITVNATVANNKDFDVTTPPIFADDGGAANLSIPVTNVTGTYANSSGVFQTIRNPDGSITFRDSATLFNLAASGTIHIELTATDADGQSVSVTVVLQLDVPSSPQPPTPTIDNPPTASSLPTFTQTASIFGDVSLAISKSYFTDDNGAGNLTLSLRDGFSPPDGTSVSISLDGTLVVSGTIRRPGTYFVPVEATDAKGQSVARTFTIVFDPSSTEPVITVDEEAVQVNPPAEPEVTAPETPLRTPEPVEELPPSPSLEGTNDTDRTEATSAIDIGIYNGQTQLPPTTIPFPSSYPDDVKAYISQDLDRWNSEAQKQPNIDNFQYYIDNYGADASIEYIADYKEFVEGKSKFSAAIETLTSDTFKNSQLGSDLFDYSKAQSTFLAELGIGFTPAGFALDARDMAVARSEGDIVGVFIAGIDFLPVIGDVAKNGQKIYKLQKESAQKVDGIISVDNLEDGLSKLATKGRLWTATDKLTTPQSAFKHWGKHKAEFPEIQNSVQYVKAAKSFLQKPPVGTLTKTRTNGDVLRFNPTTNTFGVMAKDGTPRTMFKPKEGIEYWNKQ